MKDQIKDQIKDKKIYLERMKDSQLSFILFSRLRPRG